MTSSNKIAGGGGDGSSIEQLVKRPRGRPAGSKNKPKPPIVITRDPVSTLRTHVLEIPAGRDVSDALEAFARSRGIGVCALSASGPISAATLRHSPTSLTFRGCFDLLSISAAFLPGSGSDGGMSVSLAGPHGQIVGGAVAGPVIAAGTVVVVVAAFTDPVFHRLPEEDAEASGSASLSGGGEELSERRKAPAEKDNDEQQRRYLHGEFHMAAADSSAAVFVGGQFSADRIWSPAAHPPPY